VQVEVIWVDVRDPVFWGNDNSGVISALGITDVRDPVFWGNDNVIIQSVNFKPNVSDPVLGVMINFR